MTFRELRTPKVFVPNKSFHDFAGATKFGELVFLTTGRLSRFNANDIARVCEEKMQNAAPGDYLLVSGPTSVNCVASALLAYRFGRVNFLVYDSNTDSYFSRSIVLKQKETADG